MVTNFELFFLQPDHNFFYGHKFSCFGKSIFGFQKWTKKMSKIEKPKYFSQKGGKNLGFMSRDPFLTIFWPGPSWM